MPFADHVNLVRLAHSQVAAGEDATPRRGLCFPSTCGPGPVSNLEAGVPVVPTLARESPADAIPKARLTHPWRRLIRGVLPMLRMCQDTQQRRAQRCGPPKPRHAGSVTAGISGAMCSRPVGCGCAQRATISTTGLGSGNSTNTACSRQAIPTAFSMTRHRCRTIPRQSWLGCGTSASNAGGEGSLPGRHGEVVCELESPCENSMVHEAGVGTTSKVLLPELHGGQDGRGKGTVENRSPPSRHSHKLSLIPSMHPPTSRHPTPRAGRPATKADSH